MKQFFQRMPTVIMANGEKPPFAFVETYARCATTLIALDGAADWLIMHKLIPDIVIGDMDSRSSDQKARRENLKVADQNTNDFEKALMHCQKLGLNQVTVLGAFGLRADHFLTNLHVMKKYSTTMMISLVDERQVAFICPLKKEVSLKGAIGAFVSLFPLCEQVGPIWSKGVDYPLTDEMLTLGSRIGTLNRISEDRMSIYCETGDLLIITPNFMWDATNFSLSDHDDEIVH